MLLGAGLVKGGSHRGPGLEGSSPPLYPTSLPALHLVLPSHCDLTSLRPLDALPLGLSSPLPLCLPPLEPTNYGLKTATKINFKWGDASILSFHGFLKPQDTSQRPSSGLQNPTCAASLTSSQPSALSYSCRTECFHHSHPCEPHLRNLEHDAHRPGHLHSLL